MLADANAVLHVLLPERGADHRVAVEAVVANRPVVVGEGVLVEVCWALERGYGIARRDVARIMAEALASGDFVAWEPRVAEYALALMEHVPRLAIMDCILAARAAYGEEVLTFDRALARAIEAI